MSNTNDRLRNRRFIYHQGGWLSPAYDINLVTPSNGLHLNITDSDNRLDFGLALEVIEFFQLERNHAKQILDEVLNSVANWRSIASETGISRGEQKLLEAADGAGHSQDSARCHVANRSRSGRETSTACQVVPAWGSSTWNLVCPIAAFLGMTA